MLFEAEGIIWKVWKWSWKFSEKLWLEKIELQRSYHLDNQHISLDQDLDLDNQHTSLDKLREKKQEEDAKFLGLHSLQVHPLWRPREGGEGKQIINSSFIGITVILNNYDFT